VAYLLVVTPTPVEIAIGINNTGSKFVTGVIDIGGK
jgi:hypothetical protein